MAEGGRWNKNREGQNRWGRDGCDKDRDSGTRTGRRGGRWDKDREGQNRWGRGGWGKDRDSEARTGRTEAGETRTGRT